MEGCGRYLGGFDRRPSLTVAGRFNAATATRPGKGSGGGVLWILHRGSLGRGQKGEEGGGIGVVDLGKSYSCPPSNYSEFKFGWGGKAGRIHSSD